MSKNCLCIYCTIKLIIEMYCLSEFVSLFASKFSNYAIRFTDTHMSLRSKVVLFC